jgi:hypothetical protein
MRKALSTVELVDLGSKIRRHTTKPILLDYLDASLEVLIALSRKPECPECARRRQIKAEKMRPYRGKKAASILKTRCICLIRKSGVKRHFEKKLNRINAATRTHAPQH